MPSYMIDPDLATKSTVDIKSEGIVENEESKCNRNNIHISHWWFFVYLLGFSWYFKWRKFENQERQYPKAT